MNKLLVLLFCTLCFGCTSNETTEKHQKKRDHIINVHDKIKEIVIKDVLFNSRSLVCVMGSFLIIYDFKTSEEIIHFFDKNSFDYVVSTAPKGQGPGEIANIGFVGVDESNRCFYVPDHGKNKVFRYYLDSVLLNSSYIPDVIVNMDEMEFPGQYQFLSDTVSITTMIIPIGTSDFKETTARWNMKTGDIVPLKYEHPEIKKKRICLAAAIKHGIYVEFYINHDLMTICTLDGALKYNIYGPHWDKKTSKKTRYFIDGLICDDKIVALYSGENRDASGRQPTNLLVFDLKGDYLVTLDPGYFISRFCYDKAHNRLIFSMDDEIQFAYLDLDGLF